MSKYEEIQSLIRSKVRESSDLRRQLSSYQDQLEELNANGGGYVGNFQAKVESEKASQLQEAIRRGKLKYQQKIEELQAKRTKCLASKDKELSKITRERYEKEFKEELQLKDKIEEGNEVLQEGLNEIVGSRLNKVLYSVLDGVQLDFEYDSVDEIIDRFYFLIGRIDRLQTYKSFNLNTFLKKAYSKASGRVNASTEDNKKMATLVVIYLALGFVIYFFAFPYLFIFYVALMICYMRLTMVLYSCILESKAIYDNIDGIVKSIEQSIDENMNRDFNSIEKKYDNKLGKIDEALRKVEDAMYKKEDSIRSTFKPDLSVVNKEIESARAMVDEKRESLDASIRSCTNKRDTILEEIDGLQRQLKEIMAGLVKEFIDFENPKSEKILIDKVLYNIKEETPFFLDIPREPTIFFYEDEDEDKIREFIKIFELTLFTNMSGPSICTRITDYKYGGQYWMTLIRDKLDPLIVLVANEEGFNNWKDSMIENVEKRRITMICPPTYSNIDEYNKFMLQQKSVTEVYYISIMFNVDAKSLEDSKLQQVFRTGSPLGVYNYLFLSRSEVEKNSSKLREVIEPFTKVYFYKNEEFLHRAKEFFMDTIDEIEEQEKLKNRR